MTEKNNKGVNPLYNPQKKLKNPRLLRGEKASLSGFPIKGLGNDK